KRLPIHLLRLLEFTLADVVPRQISHRAQSRLMFRTQYFRSQVQGLAVELLRFRVFAFAAKIGGQAVHGVERVGMLGAKNPPPDLQNLRMKWLSLSVAALPAQNVSDCVHDPQGIRIFSTSSSFGKRERFARKFFRFRVSSFILERDGESGHRPNRLGALRSEYSPVHFQIVRFQLFGLGITSFTS